MCVEADVGSWTEVYIDVLESWIHLDVCQQVYDMPMLYQSKHEIKQVLAYSPNEIVDVTPRYKLHETEDGLKPENVKFQSWVRTDLAIRRKHMRKTKPDDIQETIMNKFSREKQLLKSYLNYS